MVPEIWQIEVETLHELVVGSGGRWWRLMIGPLVVPGISLENVCSDDITRNCTKKMTISDHQCTFYLIQCALTNANQHILLTVPQGSCGIFAIMRGVIFMVSKIGSCLVLVCPVSGIGKKSLGMARTKKFLSGSHHTKKRAKGMGQTPYFWSSTIVYLHIKAIRSLFWK